MTYKRLLNAKTILGAGILAATIGVSPAFAISSPNKLTVDAGPLGMLNVSGGFDAYMYAMSGANANTLLGTNKDAGAEARVLDLSISKSTGLVQFTLEVKPDDSLYFGVKPSAMTANT
ncbi:MAG TPA: hypothetical protein VF286_10545, partial [Acidiphilium sp.]